MIDLVLLKWLFTLFCWCKTSIGKKGVFFAMEVSSRLQKAVDDQLIGVPFAFLRENAGRVIRLPKSGYEWGVIFREYIPYPFVDMKEFYIPFFFYLDMKWIQ